jgi:hypothetical protein
LIVPVFPGCQMHCAFTTNFLHHSSRGQLLALCPCHLPAVTDHQGMRLNTQNRAFLRSLIRLIEFSRISWCHSCEWLRRSVSVLGRPRASTQYLVTPFVWRLHPGLERRGPCAATQLRDTFAAFITALSVVLR